MSILSGLYGVLRPLDLLQPYRLEMGTRLENAKGSNLYQFWGTQIADYLNERSARKPSAVTPSRAIVVNLASQEYFKAVDLKALGPRGRMRFRGLQGRQVQDHQLPCQRARGLMVRWAVQHKAGRWPTCASSIWKAMRWPSRPARPASWCSAASCKTDAAH
jgi:cytoplasmic iron level regulating protein YaaA (DUF328/UPF0246 family)